MAEFTIGKYTLESLTTGMYIEPHVLFREYIQNSIDSLEDSFEDGILNKEESYINIELDDTQNRIIIEDNGLGVQASKAFKILTDIGNSKKSPKKHRGFRGIGRLVGLSFASKLIFETSYLNEPITSIIKFDAVKLAELLIPGQYEHLDLISVLKEVTSIDHRPEMSNNHFFRVILEGVEDKDGLLDKKVVSEYVAQIAPVPYNQKVFSFSSKIKHEFEKHGLELKEYNIFVKSSNDETERIFKPYKDQFLVDKQRKIWERVNEINIQSHTNSQGKLSVIFWSSKSNFLGTILDNSVKGLRFRKGNILIGDRFTLNSIFKEERFNGWFQGEVFVLDEHVFPNARRDNFEKNKPYSELYERLELLGTCLSKIIRDASANRNKAKIISSDYELSVDEVSAGIDSNMQDVKFVQSLHELHVLRDSIHTKYAVLNATSKLTTTEIKLLERTFDIIQSELGEEGQQLILAISEKLNLL